MICLAAGAALIALGDEITLKWRHSVEKTGWEEVWRAQGDGLRLVEARVEGAGAGMEPAPEARRAGRFWVWAPRLPALPEIALRRSGATADWTICARGACRATAALAGAADPVFLKPCR